MKEEKYCPNYRCKDCKHFRTYGNYCTKRVDHENIEVAASWFVSTPFGNQLPCCEFEPSAIHVYDLNNYWIDWEHWWQDFLVEWFPYYPDISLENHLIWFTLNGKRDIRYGVKLMDYIMGAMYDGDNLKAISRKYYKHTHDGYGYKLITEAVNGVKYK